ncbi:MAG: DUF3857 domain-containing protein [Elusimicrobiaceae bacterium]|nr:DUF3857 domain-containing protein [Elusimicrobiaceae bacterium]
MKKFILTLCLLAIAPCAHADLVHLNKGGEINGSLIRLDSAAAIVEVAGETRSYPRGELMKIQFVSEYRPGPADPLAGPVIKQLLAAPPGPQAYPDDAFLTELMEVTVDIGKDKSYSVKKRAVRYVLKERGKSPAAFVTLDYLPDLQTITIDHAYSVTDGSVSYLTDLSVMEGSAFIGYPAYNKMKTMKFAIPNVQTGSVLDYGYTVKTQYNAAYPYFGEIAFRYFEPVKLYRLTVNVPDGLALSYAEHNMSPGRSFSKKRAAGLTAYTWELRNLRSYRQEPDMPPFLHYSPAVKLSLKESWAGVRGVIAPLIEKQLSVTPEIAARAAALTAGKNSQLEKAEALYNWVAAEIKYQEVGLDQYSYIPQNTADIFAARAGNRLDKPFLLYALLSAAGFKPVFAYAADRDSLFDETLPNIRQFAAGECLVTIGGKNLVLAPFDDRHRFDEPDYQIQGTRALRLLGGENKPALLANPLAPADREGLEQAGEFALDENGNLKGSFSERAFGETQAAVREYKNYKKEDLDRAMEQRAHSIHPRARLEGYTLENETDLSKNVAYKMSISVDGYALKAGDYMIFKAPGAQYFAYDVGLARRELPLFWYLRERTAKKITVRLPGGYALYHAPAPLALKTAGSSFSASYRTAGAELLFSDEFRRERTLLPVADYARYKAFIETLARFSENWVVLKKK